MSTHGALLIGKGFSAFIDGIPDKCQHDDMGGTVFQTSSGKVVTPRTHIEWASYTSKMRDELIYKFYHDNDDQIVMVASSCSKCGKTHFPNLMDFEI